VLLKPLPYPRPDELVALDHSAPGINLTRAGAAPFLYFTYREEARVFQDVGLVNTGTVSVTGVGEPEEVPTLWVTDGVLPILGAQPMLGRVFLKTDAAPGTPETVMLASGYWRTKFGADSSAIGRTLTVDGVRREIIGVLPDSFRFLDRHVSLLILYRFDRSKVFLGQFSYSAIARLKPGISIAQASADVARLIPISLTRFPPFPGGSVKMFEEARLTPNVLSLKDDLVGDVRTVLWVLMGTIGLVLLIACPNVANLLPARAESRQLELAIRAARGAGSARIARELLLESMILGILGGIVGLGLAFGELRLLVALAPGNLPRLQDITLDVPVLLFTLALSVIAGLLFGAIPGVQVRRRPAGSRASRRRPERDGEPGSPSRAQHARRRAGRAGARAAGRLGVDDSNVSSLAGRAPGVRAARPGADAPAVDSRLPGQGRSGGRPHAPDDHGEDRRGARRLVRGAGVNGHDVGTRVARFVVRAGSRVFGIADAGCSSSCPPAT